MSALYRSSDGMLAVADLGQQLDGSCMSRAAAVEESAAAASMAVHQIIIRGVLEAEL